MKNEKEPARKRMVTRAFQAKRSADTESFEVEEYVTFEEFRDGQQAYGQDEACHKMNSKRQAGSEHARSCEPR